MNSSEWVLQVILDRYPLASREALECFLPEDERARLRAMPSTGVNTDLEEPPLLDQVHWSWLLPIFESLPLKDRKFFLGAIPIPSRESLCRELKIRMPAEIQETKIVQEFLLQTLTEKLVGDPIELLPIYFLPPTPLSPLLRMSKQQLVELIDSLALVDLATEIRQIVETKILKKIYSFLSEEEKRVLKKAMSASPPIPAVRLHLEKWDGRKESLRLKVHRRGLVRLSAALSLQHPDFTWYICHQLDIGRGNALAKLATEGASRNAGGPVIHQIEEWLRCKPQETIEETR